MARKWIVGGKIFEEADKSRKFIVSGKIFTDSTAAAAPSGLPAGSLALLGVGISVVLMVSGIALLGVGI